MSWVRRVLRATPLATAVLVCFGCAEDGSQLGEMTGLSSPSAPSISEWVGASRRW